MIKSTLILYRESLQDAVRALGRSVWGMAFLLLAFMAITVAAQVLGPFGLAGGFVLAFIFAGLAGTYLSLVEAGVSGRRRLRFSDLRDSLGTYLWEVISILFLFWIPELILQLSAPPVVLLVVSAAAALVFNPVPEMIYQDRVQSVECLQRAMSFMQRSWPEWLVPHIGIWGVLVGWGYWAQGRIDPSWLVDMLQMFGPFFEFIGAGWVAFKLAGTGFSGFVSYFLMFVFVHLVMLFRGQLYKRLKSGSRRARAWRARMGE